MSDDQVKPVKPARRARRKPRSPNPLVREKLLAAANELSAERDPNEMRIDEVAERAGVSVGTFYLYFDGKDDLFTSLVVDHTARLRERLTKATSTTPPGEDPGDRRLEAYLDFVDENRKAFLYFLRAGSLETNVGDLNTWAFSQHALDAFPLVEALLGSEAEVSDLEKELLVQAMLSVTQHLAGYWVRNGDRVKREDVKAFIRTVSEAVILHLHSR